MADPKPVERPSERAARKAARLRRWLRANPEPRLTEEQALAYWRALVVDDDEASDRI